MKLKDPIDYMALLQKVKECKGEVLLRTTQGDLLNLCSELSKYVVIFLAAKQEALKDAKIECSVPADAVILEEFLV